MARPGRQARPHLAPQPRGRRRAQGHAPAKNPATGTLAGIAVSTNGLAVDTNPDNGRPYSGWLHPGVTVRPAMTEHDRLKAFGAWWNTGEQLADELVGLLLLQTTSGFIGEVRIIESHYAHPVTPGLTWFTTVEAPKDLEAQYLGHRLKTGRGAPWVRIFR